MSDPGRDRAAAAADRPVLTDRAVERRMAAEGGETRNERLRWLQGQIDGAWASRQGAVAARSGEGAPAADPLLDTLGKFTHAMLGQIAPDLSPVSEATREVSRAVRAVRADASAGNEEQLRDAVAALREAVATLRG